MVLCTVLVVYTYYICFGYLIVALVGYYFPYFFGLKSKKKLAIWGIVLMLVIAVPFGMSIALEQKGALNTPVSSSDGTIMNGTVTPTIGAAGNSYNYTVVISGSAKYVNLLYTDSWSGGSTNITMHNGGAASGGTGTLYWADVNNIGNASEYAYMFAYLSTDGSYITTSNYNYGPITASDASFYGHWIEEAMISTFLMVGALFYLLLLLNWVTDKTKKKAETMQKGLEDKNKTAQNETAQAAKKTDKGDKLVCSECGADVPADAKVCPQCGERFDEEEDKTEQAAKKTDKGDKLVCSECGADVPADAKVCPQCGERFDEDGTDKPKDEKGNGDEKEGEYICTECGATVKGSDTKCWKCGKEFEN